MADKPASERTEKPTGKRLGKARSEGQVPQSQEFLSFVSIVALVAMVAVTGSSMCQWCTAQLEQGMSCDNSPFANSKAFLSFLNSKIGASVIVILPICVVLCIAALAGNIVVSGLNYSPKAIKLDFGAINPGNGLSKLFNMRSMVKLLASVAKLIFISAIAWYYLKDKLEVLAALRWAWSFAMLATMAKLI
ncbi:MAG: EscU/YscU/HrcU family type III secretion system export apparatus switch protein, partial [Planctomycetota bacterium]